MEKAIMTEDVIELSDWGDFDYRGFLKRVGEHPDFEVVAVLPNDAEVWRDFIVPFYAL